jgi:hypothetical protein
MLPFSEANCGMTLIYRLLGVTAYLTERASRTRGNGIPVNWLILILLGFVCAMAAHQAIEVKKNEGNPIKTTIAEATATDQYKDRYITVTGSFVPEHTLVKTDKNGKPRNEKVGYVPLIDAKGRNEIFVEMHQDDTPDDAVAPLTRGTNVNLPATLPGTTPLANVTGMLRSLDSDLKKDLRMNSRPFQGARLDDQYMLVATGKPRNFALWAALAAALGLSVLLMLFVIAKRYVIFRSQPEPRGGLDLPAIAPDPNQQFDLRVTAHFYLDQKLRQRFQRVPSIVAELENGDMALLANVDASQYFMGTKTQDRAGIWAAVISKATLSPPEAGTLYFGLTAYPAFRIRYTDPIRNAPAVAILASTTPAGRQRVRQALYEPQPAAPPPPQGAQTTPSQPG